MFSKNENKMLKIAGLLILIGILGAIIYISYMKNIPFVEQNESALPEEAYSSVGENLEFPSVESN